MKTLIVLIAGLAVTTPSSAQAPGPDAAVRQTVQAFYAAFNSHDFDRASDFTAEDWNHINPLGGLTRGRGEVLKELREVHSTFLKGVSDIIEQLDVRFATPEVAVVTVTSRMSTFTTPDGVRHEREQHVRTFVLVRGASRWLIMQDHNTAVAPQPRISR